MEKNRFITGYSGLRALAVIGVILYHLNPDTFIGGYLGVPIFFVLSGYLVTCQMLKSYEKDGFFDNVNFYWSRIKKLYPSLLSVLWLSSAYILLFQRNLLANLWQIVVSNVLSVYNFWQIFNGQSYFERFAANESPFVHLWTMSINGQFYLLWPLVVYLLVKYAKNRKVMVKMLSGLSLLSALEMAIMYRIGVNINRIYYGTDTRFFALGIGAVLAVLWPINKLKTEIKQSEAYFLDGMGFVALFIILLMFFSPAMNAEGPFPYYGGMVLFTIATTIFVAVIAHPCSHWNRWMTNPVFNWLGSRSYGIYLYQFPVMIFFEDKVANLAEYAFLYHLFEIAIILVLSELSYRFIEKPLSKISLSSIKKYLKKVLNFKTKNYGSKIQALVISLIFICGSIAIIVSPMVKAQDYNQSQLAVRIRKNCRQQKKDNQLAIAKIKKSKKKDQKRAKLIKVANKTAKSHPVNRLYKKYGISQLDLQLAHKVQLTAIGDSVMASSSNDLTRLMPKSIIDAAVSRQVNASFGLLDHYKSQHVLADNVLIALGTNGAFPMSDLNQLMQLIGSKRQVFWINTYVPNRPWQNQVNQSLTKAARRYHNLNIIDWCNYAKSHPNWFYDDHTHPTPIGSKYYSAFVVKAIVKHAKF
ncbi:MULTISPECIES: acyltransferase family protein [unclassified Lactobacillus]|uniref:acyltransferase family protein n=1 Tax=unclassified Lactobacillus TaxID=2620435 RepID=UPI000EFB9884|nr:MULTISPECIES: acyltransferase family protein [unclassified Lactobacillus]RMC46348.1 acetyltransferase [Lactobacillus sp. ESL0230]RMC50650.1 acetyltransferase [Lactobacillus sp. ESL0225]